MKKRNLNRRNFVKTEVSEEECKLKDECFLDKLPLSKKRTIEKKIDVGIKQERKRKEQINIVSIT